MQWLIYTIRETEVWEGEETTNQTTIIPDGTAAEWKNVKNGTVIHRFPKVRPVLRLLHSHTDYEGKGIKMR